MSTVSVYAVFANAEEAERIGRTVVEERLAACINILAPVRSIYRWQGKIETADEVAAIFKTHHWRADALMERTGPKRLTHAARRSSTTRRPMRSASSMLAKTA